uniref:ACT domain-containing protein n=1 Tax=Macrostomum lignano TaxID=282301 RepID=A0A1I8ITP4_9PLAT
THFRRDFFQKSKKRGASSSSSVDTDLAARSPDSSSATGNRLSSVGDGDSEAGGCCYCCYSYYSGQPVCTQCGVAMDSAAAKARRGRFSSVSSMIDEDDISGIENKLKDLGSVKETAEAAKKTVSFIFGVGDRISGLAGVLKIFEANNIEVVHVESRGGRRASAPFEIFVDVDADRSKLPSLVDALKAEVESVMVQEVDKSIDPDQTESGAAISGGGIGGGANDEAVDGGDAFENSGPAGRR